MDKLASIREGRDTREVTEESKSIVSNRSFAVPESKQSSSFHIKKAERARDYDMDELTSVHLTDDELDEIQEHE